MMLVFVSVHAASAAQLSLKSVIQTSNGWNITITLTNTGSNKIDQWVGQAGNQPTIRNSTAQVKVLATGPPDGWVGTVSHESYGADYVYFSAYKNEYFIAGGQSKDFVLLTSAHGFTLTWYADTSGGKPGATPEGTLFIP